MYNRPLEHTRTDNRGVTHKVKRIPGLEPAQIKGWATKTHHDAENNESTFEVLYTIEATGEGLLSDQYTFAGSRDFMDCYEKIQEVKIELCTLHNY